MSDTPEDTKHAVDDDEIDETPGYVPPAQKSLKEIEEQDKDDESLVKYKQTLLGNLNLEQADPSKPNVVVKTLTILFTGDQPEVVLDLTGDITDLKKRTITIKEGTEYKLKISFRVNHEIVAGLRYFQVTYRKGIRVDKTNVMVGSYGPKDEIQTFTTIPEEAPSGMLARGTYNVKSKFTDDDKNSILEWEWSFEISKEWK